MIAILCLLGIFLCFLGGKLLKPSLQISSLVVGFGIGYFVGKYIGAEIGRPEAAYIAGGVGAVATVTLTMFVLNAALFLVGALAGVVIFQAARDIVETYYQFPEYAVVGAALAGGIINWLLKKRIMAALTALIGAWLIIESGVRIAAGQYYDWTALPNWATPPVRHGAWMGLTIAGFLIQRSGGKKKKEDDD